MSLNQSVTKVPPILPTPRKRSLLTLKSKINIIKMYEDGEKIYQIAKNLNIPDSTVRTVIRDKKRIMAASKYTVGLNSSTLIRKRHGIIAKMECSLKAWCEQQAAQNIRLTRSDISIEALRLFEVLKKEYGDAAKNESFSASKGWYVRFKNRCEDRGLRDPPTNQEQKAEIQKPALSINKEHKNNKALELDTMVVHTESTFSQYLKDIIEEGEYTAQTVFNVDEIGMFWKKMPESSRTVHHSDDIGGFNVAKDRLTILLGGNVAGDLKLKPLVIYCMENPKALRNKSKAGLPVIWKSNSTASMTASLFEDWFGHYFIPEIERYCYDHNLPCKVLLLIDSANCHPPITLTDFDHRVKVIFLPQGEASSIQPICQQIATVFKALYTRNLFLHLIDTSRQNDIVTTEEHWKEFNILNAIRIMVNSWSEIPEDEWNTSWKNLCPYFSYASDLTEENSTYTEIIDEIVNIALELDMKVDSTSVIELLNSHDKDLTIEELIEMQEYSVNEELDVQDPLQLENIRMTSNNLMEAMSHIKMGLQMLENIDTNEQRARSTRLGVMKLLGPYEEILKVKLKTHQDDF